MILNEVLNTQVDYSWTAWDEDYREAKFSSNGNTYIVTFEVDDDEDDEDYVDQHEWRLKTVQKDGSDSTGMTGQGNALAAFAGTIQIVNDYQRKAKPTEMMYTLSDNTPSRLKFYNSLGKRFVKMGYKVKTKMEGGVKFWMMRK